MNTLPVVSPRAVSLRTRKAFDPVALAGVPVLMSGATRPARREWAESIHRSCERRGPFVVVDCAALARQSPGVRCRRLAERFADAVGGTLWLDEVTALGPAEQAYLVGLLDRPAAAPAERVRVVATAPDTVDHRVQSGELRRDLYYRLGVIRLRLR